MFPMISEHYLNIEIPPVSPGISRRTRTFFPRYSLNACHCRHPPKTKIITSAASSTTRGTGQTQSKSYNKGQSYDKWDTTGPTWGDHDNFPLRRQMLGCSDANKLLELLELHRSDLIAADTAAAWHVAIRQKLISLAKTGNSNQSESLSKKLLQLTERHAKDMDAASLATTAWALAASKRGSIKHMQSVLQFAENRLTSFRPQELCILLWAANAHECVPQNVQHTAFTALAKVVKSGMQLDHFTPHDLSVLIWSMGKSSYVDLILLNATEAECISKLQSGFDPADIARLMHGFAMLKHNPIKLFPELLNHIYEVLDEFSPDDISLFMISLGMLGIEPETKFMRKMCRTLCKMVPSPAEKVQKHKKKNTSIRDVISSSGGGDTNNNNDNNSDDGYHHSNSNTSNSSAGVHGKDNQNIPIDSSIDHSPSMLGPHHAGHIMWSLGKIDHRPSDKSLINRIHRHLAFRPGVYSGEDINAILWSTSILRADISDTALKAAMQRFTDVASTQNLAILTSGLRSVSALIPQSGASSIASSESASEWRSIINSFASTIMKCMDESSSTTSLDVLQANEVASLVIALGTLEYSPPHHITKKLQKVCISSAHEFSSFLLPKLAWAVVRLQWTNDQELLDSFASASINRISLFSEEGLAQLAWGFAAADTPNRDLAEAIAAQCSVKGLDAFTPKDKSRLAWAFSQMSRYGQPSQAFIKRFVGSINAQDVAHMDCIGVSAVVWACGRCNAHPGSIIDDTAKYINGNARMFSRQQLSTALAVYKKHVCKSTGVVESIMQQFVALNDMSMV